MSINGQQNINIGLPNESIGSDTLYTAFTKTQQNFSTLFTCASPYTNFVGLTGISTNSNANTGTVTITNTGVTNIIAGTNITVDHSNGNVTISATGGGGNGNGGGTVTSVGLNPVSNSRLVVTNSPVVSSGNIGIDLATTGVSAGSYTAPTLTIDSYGRITAAANTTSVGTVTSIGLTAGSGISVGGSPITTSGNITVTNTGVTRITAGSGISISAPNGIVQISAVSSGTVTSVGVTSNTLTVSNTPINSSGNINVELPSAITLTGNLVSANANLGNLAKANFFQGDGGLLTNIQTAAGTYLINGTSNLYVNSSGNVNLSAAGTANVLVVTSTGANINGTANITGNANVGNIGAYAGVFTSNVTTLGNIYANSGIIGAASLSGTLTTASQTNITSIGTLGSLNVSGKMVAGQLQGEGGNISNIQGGNISGAVSYATTANSVTGSNVSGQVNYAAVANSVAGSNVSGQVGYANVANNVAGANVSGQVNYAAVANSVAAANISGTINLANYATIANSVVGSNVSGTVANATYAVSAGTAGTVTASAQSNITSVGTLTSLTVSGALTTTNITAGANTTAGTITGNWSLSTGSRLAATYADLAEYYESDYLYLPGTVVAFGGEKEITLANVATTRVAGVVSTNPAFAMNETCPGIPVAVALQGRVPCKVQGLVSKGDMMISAGNGYAMACNQPRLGEVIGKALEDFDHDEGVIEVVVGRL